MAGFVCTLLTHAGHLGVSYLGLVGTGQAGTAHARLSVATTFGTHPVVSSWAPKIRVCSRSNHFSAICYEKFQTYGKREGAVQGRPRGFYLDATSNCLGGSLSLCPSVNRLLLMGQQHFKK